LLAGAPPPASRAGAPSTLLATTEITGLPALTVVQFRASATVSKVVGAWSQAVSILVK